MRRAACRSCGAAIVWCSTASGRHMPVDAEPVAFAGTVHVVDPGEDVPHVVVLAKGSPRPDVALYRSHFATCPAAARHRRPR